MKRRLRKAALGLARSRAGARLVALLARWVPAAFHGRVRTTPEMLIFPHPVPMEPGHLLAVSRCGVRDALAGDLQADAFWTGLAQWWGGRDDLEIGVTNLGDRQDVQLLHVHLLPTRPRWATDEPAVRQPSLESAMAKLRQGHAYDLHGRTASIALASDDENGWQCWVDFAQEV